MDVLSTKGGNRLSIFHSAYTNIDVHETQNLACKWDGGVAEIKERVRGIWQPFVSCFLCYLLQDSLLTPKLPLIYVVSEGFETVRLHLPSNWSNFENFFSAAGTDWLGQWADYCFGSPHKNELLYICGCATFQSIEVLRNGHDSLCQSFWQKTAHELLSRSFSAWTEVS